MLPLRWRERDPPPMGVLDTVFRRVAAVVPFVVLVALTSLTLTPPAGADPAMWRAEWPQTDFSRHTVPFGEIRSGGPPKDGIPSIDRPAFKPVGEIADLGPKEPVITLVVGGEARAYPLRILTWHEIANDVIAGVPVAVTYCPLCNAAIAFDRRIDGRTLEFGTTGKLRNSDLVMYDRTTESWWQQYTGTGLIGAHAGRTLAMLPTRVESFERFARRYPTGQVLVPDNPGFRPYGVNPYTGYDTARRPFLYSGKFPDGIAPMAYVVAVEDEAWALDLLRIKGRIEAGDLVLEWEPGQNSTLDRPMIADGRDIGNVIVRRRAGATLADTTFHVTFAFVFHAFRPDGRLHTE